MINTYILKIDKELDKSSFNELLHYVSEEKKERILRFHQFKDAQRTLLGDILARYAIITRTDVQNEDLVLGTNEYGKPLVLKPFGVNFNISHSGEWIMCAIDNNPVGVDVEIIKPIDFGIAKRFFSRNEYLFLINKPEKSRLEYFYRLWTLKESYIKAEGRGLSIPLNSFSFILNEQNIWMLNGNSITEYSFFQSFLDEKTVYAICSFSNYISDTTYLEFDQVISRLKGHP